MFCIVATGTSMMMFSMIVIAVVSIIFIVMPTTRVRMMTACTVTAIITIVVDLIRNRLIITLFIRLVTMPMVIVCMRTLIIPITLFIIMRMQDMITVRLGCRQGILRIKSRMPMIRPKVIT